MDIYKEHDMIKIRFIDPKSKDEKAYVATTEYASELWDVITSTEWRISYIEDSEGHKRPKYLTSGNLKKDFQHVVIDYYFGESYRREAWDKLGLVVEHLNNDGFDCCISNLFFLKKIKNYYKGIYFDKLRDESLFVLALHIFHIIQNRTFQVTIGFNVDVKEKESSKSVAVLKLLYDYDYELVLQDSENLLEALLRSGSIDLSEMRRRYRYNSVKIEHFPDLQPTREEMNLPPGSIIWCDGKAYMIMSDLNNTQYEQLPDGSMRPTGIGIFSRIHYENEWELS